MKLAGSLLGLLMTACSAVLPGQPVIEQIRELELTGRVELEEDAYRGQVTVHNPTYSTLYFGLVMFDCATFLSLHAADGQEVWNQKNHRPSRPGGCKWASSDVRLRARESVFIESEAIPESLLTSVLPAGTYHAEVRIIFAREVGLNDARGVLTTVLDSAIAVPAGTLTIVGQ